MAEFWVGYLAPGLIILAQIFAVMVPVMVGVAFLVYFEYILKVNYHNYT